VGACVLGQSEQFADALDNLVTGHDDSSLTAEVVCGMHGEIPPEHSLPGDGETARQGAGRRRSAPAAQQALDSEQAFG
jgi:hypothetical protein